MEKHDEKKNQMRVPEKAEASFASINADEGKLRDDVWESFVAPCITNMLPEPYTRPGWTYRRKNDEQQ